MPWEKQFDVDAALSAAMRAFWARGYEATSVQDLVACMGVNRGSLYGTFGDKRALFISALKRYDELYREAWVAALEQSGSAAESILGAFESAVAAVVDGDNRDGCLLVNTALELSPHDSEIGAIVSNSFTEMERYFRLKITEGWADGSISETIDAEQAAAGLLSLFIGLRVLARSRPEATLLNTIVGQARSMLR